MPFQSKAQMKFLFATKPGVAKEFAGKTTDAKALPDHKKKGKKISPALQAAAARKLKKMQSGNH